MNFFEKLKNVAADMAAAGFEKFKAASIPITLSNDVLNQAASKAFGDDSEIKSVTVSAQNGLFETKAHIKHNFAEFDVAVAFEIVRFEVNKQVQVIELRQKSELQTAAQGWRNKICVYVIKSIVSAFLGKNLLHWGLKETDGVTFAGDLISVDLAKIGVKDAIFSAMAEKIGKHSSLLLPLIQGSTDKLADYVAINSAECVDGALIVKCRFLGSSE